jgi:hypothetical protein
MPQENYFAQWTIRNDVRSSQTASQSVRHNADHIAPYQQWIWQHHSATLHWHSAHCPFDSKGITPIAKQFFQREYKGTQRQLTPIVLSAFNLTDVHQKYCGLREYKGTQRQLIPIVLSAFNLTDVYQKYCGSFDSVFFQLNGVVGAFDANNGEPRFAQIAGTWAAHLFYSGLLPLCYESFNPAQNNALTFQYHHYIDQQASFAHRWDAFLATLALYSIRWDAVQSQYLTMPFHHRAFVRPGWKLLAKNIITDELFDIGFIDADVSEWVLQDIALPDGAYEISVLTSSLFWKDAHAPTACPRRRYNVRSQRCSQGSFRRRATDERTRGLSVLNTGGSRAGLLQPHRCNADSDYLRRHPTGHQEAG